MGRRKRFWDNAGFGNHCWECSNSTDWNGDLGRCTFRDMEVGKCDSPNNTCSDVRACTNYESGDA